MSTTELGIVAPQPLRAPAPMRVGAPVALALVLFDIVTLAIAWPAVLRIMDSDVWTSPPDGAFWPTRAAPLLAYPVCQLVALFALGFYRREAMMFTRQTLGRVPLAVILAAGGASFLLWTLAGTRDLGSLFGAAVAAGGASAVTSRVALRLVRRNAMLRSRLLIVGAGKRAWDLVLMLRREGRRLNYDITLVDDPSLGPLDPRLAEDARNVIVSLAGRDLLDIAEQAAADQVVVAPDERRGMPLEALLRCKTRGIPVVQYLTFVEREIGRVDVKRVELAWLLFSDGFRFSLTDRVMKRAMDLAISTVLLAAVAPLLAGAAIAIKLDDGGPIFYRQERVTRGGRVFWIMKLRTMRVDAERRGAVWAAQKDSRITRIGAFLRRTRIDELPQLFNVLLGEMSFVGPRPERPAFVDMLARQLPLYEERHIVKAGLTGWAQINYPYGASIDDSRSKLSYDLYYVKNASILFDLRIIMQTLRVVLWPGSGVR